jgi:hypothetical protein
MEKDDLDEEMKADQLRYWQGRPASERFRTTIELSIEAYLRKHSEADPPPSSWDKAKLRVLPFPEDLNDK